jgi:energy-coupling factor transporter transmembrane protein EcfT
LDTAGIFKESGIASKLDSIDSRCRVICAFCLALAAAAVDDTRALAFGSALPLCLLFMDGRDGLSHLVRMLVGVNKVSVLALIFLPLTYPGNRVMMFFSVEGAAMALLIIWKLNIISVTLLKMVASMGTIGVNEALAALRFPIKLRMLLLLTMRYVFLMADRMSTMTRAIDLRAPDIKGATACKAYACMVGTTLVHSADRAERASLAMRCRGGMNGFSQVLVRGWTWRESALCAAFSIYSMCVAAVAVMPPGLLGP